MPGEAQLGIYILVGSVIFGVYGFIKGWFE
jgi:hypothetical protein